MYLVTILITGITMVPGMLLTTRRQRLRRWPEGLAGTADLGTMGGGTGADGEGILCVCMVGHSLMWCRDLV
jgi:hypothetical protein